MQTNISLTEFLNRHSELDSGSVAGIPELYFVCHSDKRGNRRFDLVNHITTLIVILFASSFVIANSNSDMAIYSFSMRCRFKNGMTMKTNRHPALDTRSVALLFQSKMQFHRVRC